MIWDKKGLIFVVDGKYEWNQTHASVPTVYRVDDNVLRVYFATRDTQNRTNVSYIEIEANNPQNILYVHVTLVPYLKSSGELKTKPTQHSVRELREIGIQPDILVCRSEYPLNEEIKKKVALFCNVSIDYVVNAVDVESIYQMPLDMNREGIDKMVIKKLKLEDKEIDLSIWEDIIYRLNHPSGEVNIGILQKRPTYVGTLFDDNSSCFQGQGVTPPFADGVILELPEDFRFSSLRGVIVDKFLGVSDVYVIGREIYDLRGKPVDNASAVKQELTPEDSKIWVSIEKSYQEAS